MIVVGLSIKNLEPRVLDPDSPYYLPNVNAVMVSYGEFQQAPALCRRAMDKGLRAFLGVPDGVQVYVDNGSFYFLRRQGSVSWTDYDKFVAETKPDWWPIPQDFIPTPSMTVDEQRECVRRTMAVNLAYRNDGFVPVVHASQLVHEYVAMVKADSLLSGKTSIALGGLVPNLLRSPKSQPYKEVLGRLKTVRNAFIDKALHVFGVGGNSTLHVVELMGVDSADSSGWRNRAISGLVQLPGTGDRVVASLGNWRGRAPSDDEWKKLRDCPCPGCIPNGSEDLKASGMRGFSARATHNLWVLLEEKRLVEEHLADRTYGDWYKGHLDNTIYRPLIDGLVQDVERLDDLHGIL